MPADHTDMREDNRLVTILDEAVLADDGFGQCGECGQVKELQELVAIASYGSKRKRWMCAKGCEETAILVKFLDERGKLPRRAHESDVGFDLFVSETTWCQPGEFTDVPCGIAISLPSGHWGHIVGRSSAIRSLGLMILPAVIDQGYTGPLFTGCWNLRDTAVEIKEGERVAQLIVSAMITPKLEMVQDLPQTDRGPKGFGSSGR